MKKVYMSAVFVADYLSWDRIECVVDNQMRSPEDIHEEIYKIVSEEIQKK